MSEFPDKIETVYKTASTTVYRDPAERGPFVPYGGGERRTGTINHGYMDFKGHPEAAAQVPEAVGWPELASILAVCAEESSPFRTLGCEKALFPNENPQPDGPTCHIGSYVNIAMAHGNENTETAIKTLAIGIADSVGDVSACWINVEIGIEQFVFFGTPGYCLLVRVCGHGRSEEEARRTWGYGCRKLVEALKAVGSRVP